MAHFAIISKSDDKVVQVIRVDNSKLLDSNNVEQESLGIAFCEKLFAKGIPGIGPIEDYYFKQTSYNAAANGNIAGKWYNYAGIGHTYDPVNKAFIAPKPEHEPVEIPLDANGDPILVDSSKGSGANLPDLGGGLNGPVEPTGEWKLDSKFQWYFEKFEPLIVEEEQPSLLGRMFNSVVNFFTGN